MTGSRKRLAALFIAASSTMAVLAPGLASTFVAWRVTGIAADDVLMVRAYPSATSRILVGYPDGVTMSMTGRCTGGINLGDIQMQPAWKQRQAVGDKWCELWLDPYGNGEFRNGWVFGGYIRPA